MTDQVLMVSDIIEAVAGGRMGHGEAMRRLNLDTYADLVETVHLNGRTMWAHRPVRPDARTKALLAQACGMAVPVPEVVTSTRPRKSSGRE